MTTRARRLTIGIWIANGILIGAMFYRWYSGI